MRQTALAGLLCVSVLLASCAELPTQPTKSRAWSERAAHLGKLNQWSATGKLAIRTEGESQSASLKWIQNGGHSSIVLSGPLGVGATAIEADQTSIQVSRDGTSSTYDTSSDELGSSGIAWQLPLQALPYWVRGLPAPNSSIEGQVIEEGLMRQLQQHGWTITYETYQQFEPYTLPTRLKIERQGTRAKLIIRNWAGFSS